MALGWSEQIDGPCGRKYKKFLKRARNRKLRILGKRNPELVPKKRVYSGWLY